MGDPTKAVDTAGIKVLGSGYEEGIAKLQDAVALANGRSKISLRSLAKVHDAVRLLSDIVFVNHEYVLADYLGDVPGILERIVEEWEKVSTEALRLSDIIVDKGGTIAKLTKDYDKARAEDATQAAAAAQEIGRVREERDAHKAEHIRLNVELASSAHELEQVREGRDTYKRELEAERADRAEAAERFAKQRKAKEAAKEDARLAPSAHLGAAMAKALAEDQKNPCPRCGSDLPSWCSPCPICEPTLPEDGEVVPCLKCGTYLRTAADKCPNCAEREMPRHYQEVVTKAELAVVELEAQVDYLKHDNSRLRTLTEVQGACVTRETKKYQEYKTALDVVQESYTQSKTRVDALASESAKWEAVNKCVTKERDDLQAEVDKLKADCGTPEGCSIVCAHDDWKEKFEELQWIVNYIDNNYPDAVIYAKAALAKEASACEHGLIGCVMKDPHEEKWCHCLGGKPAVLDPRLCPPEKDEPNGD